MAEHEKASNILDLMMPMFSGTKDDFGSGIVPPLPLLFDRVSEGRDMISQAPLLRLPLEIVALILRHLPPSALASLAFVNSDCRQLARSRQFASIHFDYSDRTMGLINQLQKEAAERQASHGSTAGMAIGPCIRRLTIATHPGWVKHRHDVDLSEEFVALEKPEQTRRLNSACKLYFDSYLSSIDDLLSTPVVLPHLELLDWEDTVCLESSFFDAIAKSNVHHLKISGGSVGAPFKVDTSHPWPLRTLTLEMGVNFKEIDLDLSPLYTSLLGCSASTLTSLEWSMRYPGQIRTDLLSPCPSFPRLSSLRLHFLRLADTTLLKELVHDGLVALDTNTELSPPCSAFFVQRGLVRSLETFIWHTPNIEKSPSISFLKANPQIRKLRIELAVKTVYLEEQILPLLSHRFSNLTSLSLAWDSKDIPWTSLEYISKITALEKLCIGAGEQCGWRHDWCVDHDMIRSHLSQLRDLKKLAFTRDTYGCIGSTEEYERYYVDKLPILEDIARDDWTEEMFEEKHRGRMVREATEYAKIFPQLDWIYLGQIPMAIEEDSQHMRIPRPLTFERDDCWTLLRGIFGWNGLLSA